MTVFGRNYKNIIDFSSPVIYNAFNDQASQESKYELFARHHQLSFADYSVYFGNNGRFYSILYLHQGILGIHSEHLYEKAYQNTDPPCKGTCNGT